MIRLTDGVRVLLGVVVQRADRGFMKRTDTLTEGQRQALRKLTAAGYVAEAGAYLTPTDAGRAALRDLAAGIGA